MLRAFEGAWLDWMTGMGWQVALLALAAWAVTRLLWRSGAALRYSIWLVVFLRLLLPPSLAAPWSAGTLVERFVAPNFAMDAGTPVNGGEGAAGVYPAGQAAAGAGLEPRNTAWGTRAGAGQLLLAVWILGATGLFLFMVLRFRRYARGVLRDAEPPGDGLREMTARLARDMGVRDSIDVLVSPGLTIPAVFGFWRPVIALPRLLAESLPEPQMTAILGHELAHVRRHDVRTAWLVSMLLCVYWFHPAVWLANYFLRREREMACDDAVLYHTRQEGRDYAQTLVRVAEGFGSPVPVGAGFLGMLELSDNLLLRMQSCTDVMRRRRPGWGTLGVVGLFMLLLLPMGPWTSRAAAQAGLKSGQQAPPKLVSTMPANKATGVDPVLDRITLTFDQDMARGFSWTGGPPQFPETTGKPEWVDSRTCALPVRLEPGRLYRVGINSKSHQNFRSAAGVPVRPEVLVFTTKGGDPALSAALEPPKVVTLEPGNGAIGVSPALTELVVTFDREMGGGFSWTGGGETYPATNGKPYWSEDKKSCHLPVKLKPGWSYRLGLNSPSHNNFQSGHGVPLTPLVWTFTTADN